MDALEYTPFSSPDTGAFGDDHPTLEEIGRQARRAEFAQYLAALDAAIEHINRRQIRLGRHRYGIADQLEDIGRMSRRAEYAAEVAGDALAHMEATR